MFGYVEYGKWIVPFLLFVFWTCRTFNERVAWNFSSSELPGSPREAFSEPQSHRRFPELTESCATCVDTLRFNFLLVLFSLPPNTRSWTFQKQLAAGEVSSDTLSLWCTLTRRQTEWSWQRSSVSDTQTAAVCVCVNYIWLQLVFVCTTSACLCTCVWAQVFICRVCVCVQLSWSSQVGVSWRHCQPGLIFSFPIRGSIPVTQLTPRVALPCHFATRIKAKTSWK